MIATVLRNFVNEEYMHTPVIFCFYTMVCAQNYNDSTSTGNVEVSKRKGTEHIIGLDIRPSYLFPTHEFFKGNNNAGKKNNHSFAGHVKYGFKFSPDSKLGRLYPHAIQGIGIGYNTFSILKR